MSEHSSTANFTPALRFGLSLRLAILSAVFFGEKVFLSALVDLPHARTAGGFGSIVYVVQRWGFRFLVAWAATIAAFALVRNRGKLNSAVVFARTTPIRIGWVLTHILLVAPLVPLSSLLYRDASAPTSFAGLVALWIAFGSAAAGAAFAAMAPLPVWKRAAGALGVVWVYSAITAILGASAMQLNEQFWAPASALTFELVRYVLAPILPNLSADASALRLSTDRFAVIITEGCSGLEGMSLMLAFCGAWLLYFRRDYIFPRALLLIPVGLLAIFGLNVLRIAVLILIGHGGFPEVAVYGFHSQAGWIAFNAAACGLAFVSRRNAWLHRTPRRAAATVEPENPTATYVMPLLAVLIAGMVSHAFTSDFDWLYPLRLVAGVAMLAIYRWRLAKVDWRWSWRGPAVGVLIFAVWVVAGWLLLPPTTCPVKLASTSPLYRGVWITSRIVTSVLVVPIVEELAYRGFLMRRLIGRRFELVAYRSVNWLALCLSALAFGLPHGVMWLPAAVAGLAYGFVLIRRGRIGEAVIAHATTNMLIAAAVLGWNQWQLW